MKYILKRGHKKCAYDGIRKETRGNVSVTVKVPIIMEPGKAVETDLDMSNWVEAGVMVAIKSDPVPVIAPVVVPVVAPEPAPVREAVPTVVPAPAVEIAEEPSVLESEDAPAAYEELEDGTFHCLLCAADGVEKIVKSESGMLKHISQKH